MTNDVEKITFKCMKVNLSPQVYEFDAHDLIMSATSYYLGRSTINVHCFCRNLRDSWPMLPKDVKGYIKRVVESAFSRYEAGNSLALGHDVDRDSWELVRALWKEPVK